MKLLATKFIENIKHADILFYVTRHRQKLQRKKEKIFFENLQNF